MKRASSSVRGWKPITGPIDRAVLVTNNITALNASGRMSHVWLVEYVHQLSHEPPQNRGYYYALDGPGFLTHYCEVPQALPAAERRKQFQEQKAIRRRQWTKEEMAGYKEFV